MLRFLNLGFPQNYRPFGLLNALVKVPEKVIHKLLLYYSRSVNLYPVEQFGLLKVNKHNVGDFSDDKYTGPVFLDVSNTFDKVWQNGLL